jgi:LysR family transcriptional regulator of abg operon
LHLTQLRNLVAVVGSGSIRSAARELHVSQPALTRSIRQLEIELEVKLLERTARGVVPTPAGRAFVARSRVIHNELGRAREELAQIAGEHPGSVAFGAGPQAAIHVVPRAIAQFRREHPEAKINVADGLPHVLLPQLREGSLDFFVGVGPQGPLDAHIQAQPLYTSGLMIATRKGHPRRGARSLRELVDEHWIVYTPAGWSGAIIPDIFEKNGLPLPKSVTRSDSYVALLTIIAGTDLVGALSNLLLAQPLAREFFEALQLREKLPENVHYLFMRRDSPLTPAAAAMAAAIKAAARKLVFSSAKR